MNKNILLACRDAVIGYDNTVAVNGVSFELERGDYLCIVGENGSGKSTLLKGILGLIPMRGGSVDFAMALFVLGDPHLSLGASKPMDIFPGWNDYVDRLEKNWRKLITPQDTIVLAGDIQTLLTSGAPPA